MWEYIKSRYHKRKTRILGKFVIKLKKLKRKPRRRRNFQDIDFETNDYAVKKSEEALNGCFLTLRITPKNDISLVNVLIEELPKLIFESIRYILEKNTYF